MIVKFNFIRLFCVAVIALCIVGLYTINITAYADYKGTSSGSGWRNWNDGDGSRSHVDGSKSLNDDIGYDWKECKECKQDNIICRRHKRKLVNLQKESPGRTQNENTNISDTGFF